jgi:23S rRNA pseudouridine2605 synthase
MERLQRVLAARGVGSRRRSEDLIRAGRVAVNGHTVTTMGTKVDPRSAEIRVDGKLIRPQALHYVLLNKPRGYITTTSDERGRQTVMDLVPIRERLYPVGRLDRETEGLLLLTNDGEVANRVMHPRYGMTKEYHVLTLSRPDNAAFRRITNGVVIDGKKVVPDEFRILRETREGLILKIVVHEGMKRIVRRIMDEAGIPVERLRRVRVGPLILAGLPLGSWRELTDGERSTLFEALRLGQPSKTFAGREPRAPARRSWRDRGNDPDQSRGDRG